MKKNTNRMSDSDGIDGSSIRGGEKDGGQDPTMNLVGK